MFPESGRSPSELLSQREPNSSAERIQVVRLERPQRIAGDVTHFKAAVEKVRHVQDDPGATEQCGFRRGAGKAVKVGDGRGLTVATSKERSADVPR